MVRVKCIAALGNEASLLTVGKYYWVDRFLYIYSKPDDYIFVHKAAYSNKPFGQFKLKCFKYADDGDEINILRRGEANEYERFT